MKYTMLEISVFNKKFYSFDLYFLKLVHICVQPANPLFNTSINE
jgi:hypothetical protein